MDQDTAKPAAPPEKGDRILGNGMITGIAIVIVIAILFGIMIMGNTGSASPATCDAQSGTCPGTTTPSTPTPVVPVKSARPSVELYVMSFCPFGVQMETAMRPVVALLGDSIDMKVRYIASARGDTVSTVQSLHGNAEGVEDVRQLCVAEHAPEKYWDYLKNFNAECYPSWNNATALAACQENVTAALGIPADTISQCMSGGEGLQLLKEDAGYVAMNKATSSPTLLINGQKFSGSRTPENVKQAVCNHFETSPAACDTLLSTTAASASGSC